MPVALPGSRPILLAAGFAAMGWLVICGGCGPETPRDELAAARQAIEAGDFRKAATIASEILPENPRWIEAQLVLAEAASSMSGPAAGMPYLEAMPRDGSRESLRASQAMGQYYLREGVLSQAAENLDYVLQHHPEDVSAQSTLASILIASGQHWLADPHFMALVKSRQIELQMLVMLTAPDRRNDQTALLNKALKQHPEDPFVQLGLAVAEAGQMQVEEARKRVGQIVQSHPELGAAQALLGQLILDGPLEALEAWDEHLPPRAEEDPDVWYVRGRWARRIGQNEVAARCFWESIRRAPAHQRAMYQLGQLMTPIDAAVGEAFSRRAAILKECGELTEQVLIQQGRAVPLFQTMLSRLIEMGRDWEAWAWMTTVTESIGVADAAGNLQDQLTHVVEENPPRFRAERDLSRLHDLSTYPGWDQLRAARGRRGASSGRDAPLAQIHFDDQAAAQGIEFSYNQGPDLATHGVRIFESTGGGVGIIDFDNDGWPDLFLTQGEDWPPGSDRPVPSKQSQDRLYRNSQEGFRDVTEACGLDHETGYGQGCSCGDFNNDGFIDLYVANIGVNQLWINNGDGTFSDGTQESGITGAAWTTSCLIADLNADGSPDLYDVNYLQGDKVFSVECSERRCSVRGYEGAPDQVQLSQGDGTLAVVADATPRQNAKGLGIVALFMGDDSRPSLFIANDQVPNHFLRPADADGRYRDEAPLVGLALNMDGQPTACMGVAAGDVDHDRRTDLFVTNFKDEANNLYMQRDGGMFEDAVNGTGLLTPGIPYVSWGTQLFDADNDGELDLAVANGHVADFAEPGVEYQMPAQFFRNLGACSFREEAPSDVGSLFGRKGLGRSLALVDWNRDGRVDFVLSSIAAPCILASNQTEGAGHFFGVRLRARNSARDALGTVVDVRVGDSVRAQQLLSGDGYQATNERRLNFGLGSASHVDEVTIRWPAGGVTRLSGLPADVTLDVVEGQTAATLWKGAEPVRWSTAE